MMKPERPKRVKTMAMARHVDGHFLKALAGSTGLPGEIPKTAEINDYAPAHPDAIEFNKTCLENGEISGFLKKSDKWNDAQGVAFVQLPAELNTKAVVQEMDERFQDGKLSFAANHQFAEYTTIKGGWAEEYKNVLNPDRREQEKSVVAVKNNLFTQFKKSFPFTNDVVKEVHAAIRKIMPDYGNNLVPHEYTFFFGTSKASCTKWHSDQAEHKGVVLKLTTLTLLSSGETSMNVASKDESWLKTPFATVMFDPKLFHRSGVTSYEIIKLSIHWKLRSVPPVKVEEEVGTSGVKEELEEEKGDTSEPSEAQQAKEDEVVAEKKLE